MSTSNALAFVGYPKEIWIVSKNLVTLVVRGSDNFKFRYVPVIKFFLR
ncbi:hypothetical protein NHI66_000131 [Clostridium botulinum]|nr:hypothetical protein [Clostridium botulinum]